MDIQKEAKIKLLKILRDRLGEDNAIKRADLLVVLNRDMGYHPDRDQYYVVSDRNMRQYISELRVTEEGMWICSTHNGGYFMAKDIKELNKVTSADHKKGVTIITNVNRQRKIAGLHIEKLEGPQMRLDFDED